MENYTEDLYPVISDIHPSISEEFELHDLANGPTFTFDPIPKHLRFSELENYLISLPSIGYGDQKYAFTRLNSHFSFTQKTLKNILIELIQLLNDIQEHLTENYSRKLIPYKQTKTAENANLWRTRVILFIKQIKLKRKLELHKLDICYKSISITKKLIRITKELIERPRNVSFNINSINRLPQIIKTETCVRYILKIKAIEAAIADIKIVSKFIPRLFTKPEVCSTVLINIIKASLRFRDPLTSYLPETPDFATFVDFLHSRFSPIRYNDKQSDQIDTLISSTVEKIRSFANIKETTHVQILTALSVRYWFNRTLICDIEYSKTNPELINYIHSLKNNPIQSLNPPQILIKSLKHLLKLSIIDYITEEEALFPAIGELFMCFFCNSPVDIAFRVYSIHLRFAGFMSQLIKKSLTDKNTLECVAFLWKVLIISSDLPCYDAIFSFVIKYAQISFVPQILYEKCTVPYNIIKNFKTQMK